MSTSRDTGSSTIKMFDPENIEIAVGFLMLCAVCSTTRDMPGGKKYPPPNCRQT